MKFTPGIQRTSKNGDFFGFTTIYHRQGQLDILKVIEGKESPKDFLQSCCLNNLIGDYLFLFYVSSLDHKDVREFPIHVVIKKNGFSDRLVHIVKRKIIKDITSCGYYIPYTFSDGDGLDQQFQNRMIDAWLPKLIKNLQSIEKCEFILNNDCFYNFQIQSNEDDDECLLLSDGMHLSKRIRYEVVNRQNLFLVRPNNGKTQFASFYLQDFQ